MRISRLAQAIVTAGLTSTAFAGGFSLTEQSVSAMGTGNAGRASNAQDASTVYNNPAAMMQLKKAQVTAALAFIDASSKIENASGPLPGTNEGDMVPHTFVPSGYFASGDKGGWSWGLATYGSFGLKTNYEPSFAGRYLGDKSSVKVITFQPAVSYQLTDRISIGGGPTLNKLNAYLSKDTTVNNYGVVSLKGDDIGYGYNLGVHARLPADIDAGVVYRSKVRYKIDDGRLNASGGTLTGNNPVSASASTAITLPESVELGFSKKLSPKLKAHASATWTRWSRLKNLPVSSVINSVEVFNWKDSIGYSMGLTHACSDKLELRAGLAFDNSPVSPNDRSVRLPSADRRIASVGAGYKLSPTQSVDVSYSYLREEGAAVHNSGYNADYHNRANIFGLQFTQQL